MWDIILHGLIHLAVIIVVAILFHFMYIFTIPSDRKLLRQLSDWALGLGHLLEISTFIVLIDVMLVHCSSFILTVLAQSYTFYLLFLV